MSPRSKSTRPWRLSPRRAASALLLATAVLAPASAAAQEVETPAIVPAIVEMPAKLGFDEAVRMFRTRGLDLLLADAAIASAQGQAQQAGAIKNPTVSVSAGPFFNYSPRPPCSGCVAEELTWGVGDGTALVDFLSGKRGLRTRVAQATLAATRLARADAQRTLEAIVKQQYVQVVLSKRALAFNRELVTALSKTLEITRLRYPAVANEADLARIEVQKLEGDQSVSSSLQTLEQARMGLAFLLGARGSIPDFAVEDDALAFRVPAALESATEQELIRRAIARRPDLRAAGFVRAGAMASLELAKRNQIPDVTTSLAFAALGYGQTAPTAPTLMVGAAANLPIFYQQQGAIRSAQAGVAVAALQQAKSTAMVASDVGAAFVGVTIAKRLVERMEGRLLAAAKLARDAVEKQFNAGAITLTNFLDAERTYVGTNVEYLNDLAAYWTAVFQLEQAVGEELSR